MDLPDQLSISPTNGVTCWVCIWLYEWIMRCLKGLELSIKTRFPSQASKEGQSVLPLLEAMAEQHPQALYYQFKISSETLNDAKVYP